MLADKSKLIWFICIGVLLLIIISNNVSSILNYRNGIKKIEDKEKELVELEAENQTLIKNIKEAQKPEYQQKLAIEELNLTADQATILIIPKENDPKNPSDVVSYSTTKTPYFFAKWVVFLKLK